MTKKQTVEMQFLSNAKMMLGELRAIRVELLNIRLETDRMNKSHAKGASGAKKHSSEMKGLAMRFVGYNLILNQVMGAQQKVIDFTKESVKAFRDFENALAEVSTILTADTLSSIYEFRGGMESLSITFGKAATDLAKATYQILSAAFDADNAMQLLTIATKGAVAGITSVETSVDVLTSILNAYGQEASQAARMSDYLFQTVVRGKLVYEDYASALGYITPIAANAGIEFKELAAIMSTSTRMGLHLDMTVRGLALMMQGLINPTEQVAKAAKKYNFEIGALQLRIFGLQDMFQQLNAVSKEFGDHVIGEIVPNMRATRVAAAAAGDEGILGLATDMEYLTNSAGKTEEAMSKIIATTKFMSDQMAQMSEQIKRDFGESLTLPMLEFERLTLGLKSGVLGLLGAMGKLPEMSLEETLFPPLAGFKYIAGMVEGFKEGADESNAKVRQSFEATANFIKNTMLATIAATEGGDRKSLFESLMVEDTDVDKILASTVKLSDIGDRIDIKEKISQQVEGLAVALDAAGQTFIMHGGDADAYATYMERVIHLQQAFLPGIRQLESELLLTENVWNEVTGALASFDEVLEDSQTNVNLLNIELSSLGDEVGEVGEMFDGTLGVQVQFKEDVAELEDKIRALQNAIKGETGDLGLVSEAMKLHIAEVNEQKDAYDALTLAMSKNRLAMMKIELKGMLRRRGLLRSEQKLIKKYQISNKEISIEQLQMKLIAEDEAATQHKEILDTELSDLREQLRQMKDTRYDDIANLKATIVEKESEITKWTDALATEQLKIETLTETHTQFIASLYSDMTTNILAEFERLSGYDITKTMTDLNLIKPQGLSSQSMLEKLPLPLQTILQSRMPGQQGGGASTTTHIDNVTIEVKELADMDAIEKFQAVLAQSESSGLMKDGKTNYRLRIG